MHELPFGQFKDAQRRYPRVRAAYSEKEAAVVGMLESAKLSTSGLRLYIRAFKQEQEIEVWGANGRDKPYVLVKNYEVCASSGELGPKRKQGDLQVPEGFYHIDRFNPVSRFHLSLGVNYPNQSDRILGHKPALGGDIFIHGDCVTIGCLPITDDKIKELYIMCIEAKDWGQPKIPVTIFPCRMDENNYDKLKARHLGETKKLGLWADLKKGHDLFNAGKQLPSVSFLANGRHRLSK